MKAEEEVVQSGQVLDFLTVANEYCMLVEGASSLPRENMLGYLHRILPLLYLKASLLPDIPPPEENLHERFMTEEQWENSFNDLRTMLGDDDHFWNIEHMHDSEAKPEKASVAEQLADIYQEMKDFVLLFQKPLTTSREHAVIACRYFFYEHWGVKALTAATIIHKAIYPCCDHGHDHDTHEHTHP
jgi:hypothetical protein